MKKCIVVATVAAAVCLVSLWTLSPPLGTVAVAQPLGGQTSFFFNVVSRSTTTPDLIVLAGTGQFNNTQVAGGGHFTHFTPAATPPFPIVASGTFTARRLVSAGGGVLGSNNNAGLLPAAGGGISGPFSFRPTTPPSYGSVTGGVLVMQVDLLPVGRPRIPGATMTVVCNVGAGGISTGQPEGVFLTVPGGQSFVPQVPAAGLTSFTSLNVSSD